jgi:hypothetical protein
VREVRPLSCVGDACSGAHRSTPESADLIDGNWSWPTRIDGVSTRSEVSVKEEIRR